LQRQSNLPAKDIALDQSENVKNKVSGGTLFFMRRSVYESLLLTQHAAARRAGGTPRSIVLKRVSAFREGNMEEKMKKRAVSLLLCASMAVSSVTGMGVVARAEGETEAATENVANTEESANYPLTVSTFNYAKEPVEETFEKAPERVLTFWQNSLETLLALGLGDRIICAVGVSRESVLPELQEEFDKVASGKEYNEFVDSNAAMSKEYAIMLEPDFILGWKSSFSDKTIGDVDYWHENGINTYMALNSNDISENRTLENEYTDILTIGKIFDAEDKAQEIVDEMKNEVARVTEATQGQEKKTVLVVEFMKDSIWNYDKTTLAGNMITEMGGELLDAAGDLGAEDLINLDPDVIFVIGDETKTEKLTGDQGYASLKAVQDGAVYPIDLSDVYTSGVRTINGLNEIGRALYPELYTE